MVWARSEKGRRLYREENNGYGTTRNKEERETQEKVCRCVKGRHESCGSKERGCDESKWMASKDQGVMSEKDREKESAVATPNRE